MSEIFTVDNLKIGDGLSLVRSDEGARDKFTLSLSRDILESDGIIHFDHTDLFKGRCAIWHEQSGAVGFESDIEPRSITHHDGGIALDFSDFGEDVSGSMWFKKSKQSMLTPFKIDCPDVTIEGKNYHSCRLGWGEIGPIFVTENYNGASGVNPNNDAAFGTIYGKLTTAAEMQALEAVQVASNSDFSVPTNHHFWAMLRLLGGIIGTSIANTATMCSLAKSGATWNPSIGNDKYEFSLTGSGFKIISTGVWSSVGKWASIWSIESGCLTVIATGNTLITVELDQTARAMPVRFIKKYSRTIVDDKEYKTCYMGNTWWTAEDDQNLRFGMNRPTVANTPIYGTIYNFQKALDYDAWLKSCDSKFRIPRSDEYRYVRLGIVNSLTPAQMISTSLWNEGSGNNQSGFGATPGGYSWDGTAQAEIGNASRYATVTTANATTMFCFYANTSTMFFGTEQLSKVSGYCALRLVQRFFDVPMPWGEVRRFVKIGNYFIDTRNFDWVGEDGTLGRFYQDNPALGVIHGRLYTGTEALAIQDYLRDKGVPLGVPTQAEWTSILSYNNGTHGTTLPADASAFLADSVDTYELGLTKDGWLYNGSFNYIDASYFFHWTSTGTQDNLQGLTITAGTKVPSFKARVKDQFSFSIRLIFRAF